MLTKCRCRLSTSVKEVKVELSDSRCMHLSTGKLAKFADGCCVASSGDTNVMVTVVSRSSTSPSASFIPLTVDFRHKSAAVGKIPTNFFRRDLGANEKEILTSRVIDRSIRPLFPSGYFNETQVICNTLSIDGVHDPDVLSINAASAALTLSDVPWHGPVGAVRVGLVNNEVVINPTRKELLSSKINFIITGAPNKSVLMIDGHAKEPISVNDLRKVLSKALKETQKVITEIRKLEAIAAKPKRTVEKFFIPTQEQIESVKAIAETRLSEILTNHSHDKISRDSELTVVRQDVLEKLKENYTEELPVVLLEAYNEAFKDVYRNIVFETNTRCDGRNLSQLRNISCEVGLYKPLHGSSIFQRGQTQVLCSLTLDSHESAMKVDPISALFGGMTEKNFMLHYEFPSYATNEIGRVGSFGRREIGHGALAEKALRAIVPPDFPFTIRLNCEVLESNGSSSMASVCAGSLALLDAGVNILAPAAGVAIGLLSRTKKAHNEDNSSDNDRSGEESEYKVLTDILGIEDYLGEMDFKIAGTKDAFTAIQLDTKLKKGIPLSVLFEAINSSISAKKEILSIMNSVIRKPNESRRETWPVIKNIEIPPHKRAALFGFGGHTLKRLSSEIGVRITPDEEDKNLFQIFAPNQSAMDEADEFISGVLAEEDYEPQLDFGGVYNSKIVEIKENGVLIELHPKMKPVFLHLKELDQRKVRHPSALGLEVGQELQVKYFGRDPTTGHIRISRRILQMTTPKAKNFIGGSQEKEK
ncbi:Polyribonucleotide nucleotidyltransferase 1-like protein [Dinothrombium tinctorium]|uniref:polyribonucleotide nucleotidyltransferase n=1 Tax=Dinothrombium tinctorium TaxID=1965070 RepID=A0A3S5WGU5_9ACAR|nr:Polyribonucleotide nucleotidyltransferase 1-like protein [Dinothrombium tinctorium]RWS07684.1 Polyribonucleotide nucleotidyltransferase 1-like protein [Dinothrombium tinctorium]RWS07693.1 Polyribonucleotide nucleotidyltransferase 1-like protein [Dinothrombium tinctorium]